MKLTKLREIAMAATPGPWEHVPLFAGEEVVYRSDLAVAVARSSNQIDGRYIATFSPEMVLKLLEVIDAAEECLEGFTRHPHPAMKYNEHQVRHGAHEDFAIALAALKETE